MANRNHRALPLACLSAIVPGLGQVLRGHFLAAILFCGSAFWVHAFLGAQAPAGGRLTAFLFGAPAIPGGLKTPFVVFFTLIALALHGLSAWEVLGSAVEDDGGIKKAGEV